MARGTGNGIQLDIGERKGLLCIVGKVENSWRWRAVCDCGNYRSDISAWDWRNNKSAFNKCKDCAQPNKPQIGKKYGLVTVIREYKSSLRGGRTAYVCICECGKELKERTASVILRPNGTGCISCHRKKAAKSQEEATVRAIMVSYRQSARKRGFEFFLSEQDIKDLIFNDCFYCGSSPSQVHSRTKMSYNGIDRQDNLVGYKPWNVVSCCPDCNYAKRNKTMDEFIDWINRLTNKIR